MYDDYAAAPARSRSLLALLAALLALGALAAAGAALVASRSHERALADEVAGLERQVAELRAADVTLAGRVQAAERTLGRRESGLAPLAQRVLRSVFTVETPTGYGSGFVAWQEGGASFLVTAHHVVDGLARNFVTVSRRGGTWSGEIVARDPANDLAAIRIAGRPAGAKPLWQEARVEPPRAGDEILLVGSPYGLEGSVTTGVVSRVTRKEIQTDAAANPGNSGGPALDEQGRIVGVLVSGGGQNVNFAVPIRLACRVLRDCG